MENSGPTANRHVIYQINGEIIKIKFGTKHQVAEKIVSHRLHKPMESSEFGLQRQTQKNFSSGDVHPKHALEAYLHLVRNKTLQI